MVLGAVWGTLALVIVALGLIIDPLGVSPIGVSIKGFNNQKPLRADYDRLVKRVDVRRGRPATIFMGSSRIKQTIDPRLLAGTVFAPAYNAGINGSADVEGMAAYLGYYLDHDPNLRHVFIEAFPSSLLSASGKTGPDRRIGLDDELADYTSVVFTMDGLESLVETVSMNRRQPNAPVDDASQTGYVPIVLAPHHFSVRNIFNQILHLKVLRRGTSLSPHIMATARVMVDACRSRGVECRFFLSPLHADALFAIYHLGLWPEFEALKRALADVAPTYDFTRYSALIEERSGPVVYWPEAFHFSPALGAILARVMTAPRPSDVPENFGALLDPSTVDESLAAWRGERDRWIVDHPDAPLRMRKAEDEFLAGVPFSVVTQREIDAGGW